MGNWIKRAATWIWENKDKVYQVIKIVVGIVKKKGTPQNNKTKGVSNAGNKGT